MVIAPEVNLEGKTGRYEILSNSEYTLGVYDSLNEAKNVILDIQLNYCSNVNKVYYIP